MADSSSQTAIAPDYLSWEQALAYLQGPDLSLRYYSAWYLGTTRDRRAVEPLLQALKDDEDRTPDGGYPLRRNAAKALGLIADVSAFSGLVAALSCSDLYVREEAAHALGRLGEVDAVPHLLGLLTDHLQHGREQPLEVVIEALGKLQARDSLEVIRPFLQHSSERVQSASAWVLYRFSEDLSVLQTALNSLQHESAIMRQTAVFDLAESGWLGGAERIATADVGIGLRLNALKRLFDVAQSCWSQEVAAVEVVIPFLDQLL